MLWRVSQELIKIVKLRTLTSLLFFCTLVLFIGCTDTEKKELELLESYKKAPYFTASNSNGKTFSTEELSGKYSVISFFFASCEEVCPKVNSSVASLNKKFGENTGIEFVSITVDPDNDNDSVLNAYKKRFNGSNNWVFLRMPIDSLVKITSEGFSVGHLSEPSLHSSRMILVDKSGMIRGYFDGLEQKDVDKLSNHLEKLLN